MVPADRPWKPDDPTTEKKDKKLVQILADADDSDQVLTHSLLSLSLSITHTHTHSQACLLY